VFGVAPFSFGMGTAFNSGLFERETIMAIQFQCQHCSATLRVKDELGGKNVKCPTCKGVIQIPLASSPKAAPQQVTPSPEPPIQPASPPLQPVTQIPATQPSPQSQSPSAEPAAAQDDAPKTKGVGWLVAIVLCVALMGAAVQVPMLGILLAAILAGGSMAYLVLPKIREAAISTVGATLGGLKGPAILLLVIGLFALMRSVYSIREAGEAGEATEAVAGLIEKAESAHANGKLEESVSALEKATDYDYHSAANYDKAQDLLQEYSKELGEQQTPKVEELLKTARSHITTDNGKAARDALKQAVAFQYASNHGKASKLHGILNSGLGKSIEEIRAEFPMLRDNQYQRREGKHGLPNFEWKFDSNLRPIMGTSGMCVGINIRGPSDGVTLADGMIAVNRRAPSSTLRLIIIAKLTSILSGQTAKTEEVGKWITANLKASLKGSVKKRYGSLEVSFATVPASNGGVVGFTIRNAYAPDEE